MAKITTEVLTRTPDESQYDLDTQLPGSVGDTIRHDGSGWSPVQFSVFGDGTIQNIIKVTQVEYDVLSPPDPSTLYVIGE